MIYLEEAFKFIPREQIVVTRTEDYAKSEVRDTNYIEVWKSMQSYKQCAVLGYSSG